jgi:hypothetical protein
MVLEEMDFHKRMNEIGPYLVSYTKISMEFKDW